MDLEPGRAAPQVAPTPSSGGAEPRASDSLARKYSRFTSILLIWVAFVFLAYDLRTAQLDFFKLGLLAVVVPLGVLALSQFTNYLLAKPLMRLQEGVRAVQEGHLEPIQVSRTGDEVEYLGNQLNQMIAALRASRAEVQEYREMLEDKIRQRTEALQEATDRALAASRAKSDFLANVSHELRTPMNGILGMIDIVLDEELAASHREQLEIAQGCAHTLLALLNDLLDLAKIEAGKMLLERIAFDLHALTEDCVRSVQPRAREKGIPVGCSIDAAVPVHVMGDPLRIRQVLTNLVGNAVKFTEMGRVDVSVGLKMPISGTRAWLSFTVRDTGVGIAPDKVARIFEEFTQADSSVSRRYGGTGLGLAITRRLVEMHNGSISVDSSVGQGSTFRVEIPLETVKAKMAAAPGNDRKAGEFRDGPACDGRILVVEDNVVNQRVVSSVLKKHGYQVTIACNGREALDVLQRQTFDLVLMDIQMPELDGITAARHIRDNPRWSCLPIVAMTAHAMMGDKERCIQAGMNGYLSKPVAPNRILEVVREHLQNRRQTESAAMPASQVGALPAPIDRLLAARLLDGDSNLVAGMVLLFLQLAPERMQRLHAAAVRMDALALQSQAHKLEKAAYRIAATEVARRARDLADIAHTQSYSALEEQINLLGYEIRRLEAEVHSRGPVREDIPTLEGVV